MTNNNVPFKNELKILVEKYSSSPKKFWIEFEECSYCKNKKSLIVFNTLESREELYICNCIRAEMPNEDLDRILKVLNKLSVTEFIECPLKQNCKMGDYNYKYSSIQVKHVLVDDNNKYNDTFVINICGDGGSFLL